jgi:glycosyltransferase involved in cell wall biosynthesis
MTPTAQRILICLHDFSRGGTERIAIGLAKIWAEAGRDVTILCGTTEGGLRNTLDPRIRVEVLDPAVRRSLFSRIKLGREMGKRLVALSPDLIFLPGNFHLFLNGALHKACPRAAIVSKVSNPPVPHWLTPALGAWVVRRFSRHVDGFAAMNSGLARELRALVPGRVVATLFDPVYINHDGPFDHVAADDGRFNILWAGRFEPQKDVVLALKTIQALNSHIPARLTMLGEGSLFAATQEQIGSMNLRGMIEAPGHVANIDPYLRQADALLVTSHYEGGPAVAVEALAHGVRVVSTDCSHFLHDVMRDAEAGIIVPSREPGDLAAACVRLHRTAPPSLETLSALVAQLEPAPCAQAYLDWFDQIVATRHAQSA